MCKDVFNESAYVKMQPITNPSQIEKIKTAPFDEEWEKRISSMWWYHKNNIADARIDKRLFALRSKLLEFGGSEVCMPVFEPELNELLQYGQLWFGDRYRLIKGEPCHCHSNSSQYYLSHKDNTVLCTGYALSEDGMWRQRASRS